MSNHTNKTLKIDVFSRYAWVEPLKNKTAKEGERGLMIILNQVKSRKIRTDEGSEFNHKWVKTIKFNYVFCFSDTGSSCHVTVMGSLIVLVNKRAD
jgi:hypothetical protein